MQPDDAPTVTIRDVAQAAGVGVSTASRALGGAPTGARGQAAAERIRRIAVELGYVPHHAARALRGRRTSMIVLTDDPSRATSAAVVAAMEQVAAGRSDLFVSAAAIGPTETAQLDAVRLACSLRPLAIVVSSTRLTNPALAPRAAELLSEYRRAGGRLVVIGSPLLGGHLVSIGNVEAGVTVGRHAAGLGRSRYTVLAGDQERAVFTDRTEGFLRALDEIGVPRREVRIEHGPQSRAGGQEAMQRVLADGPAPQVVLAVNDLIAFGAMAALREAGLSVPGDVALTGIDDDPLSGDLTPALTTYAFPFDEVGLRAAELALAEPEAGEAGPTVISGRLLVRASTVPA